MKTKLIVWGLTLVPLVYVMSKLAFAVPENGTMLFMFVLAVLMSLPSLFVYQMKVDMTKMQRSMDDLSVELRRLVAAKEVTEEPFISAQQVIKTDVKKKLWHELEQTERDKHIAKICESSFNVDPPKVFHESGLPQI